MVSVDQTFFVQLVIFLLTVFVINLFMFKPIFKTLEKRNKLIFGSKDEAEKLEKKTEIKVHSYERRIVAARQRAKEERKRLVEEGTKKEAELLAAARKETEAVLSKASSEIAQELSKAKEELSARIDDLAREIASKLAGRDMGTGRTA